MTVIRTAILAGVSSIGLTIGGSALAQDNVAPQTAGPGVSAAQGPAVGRNNVEGTDPGNEIIVTARRRDEDLQDVPLVVNAVTQEQVEKLNLRSLNEVQTVVPGLTLASGSNGVGGTATLRGVNFDVNASGSNPTVEFYYNDAPIASGVLLQSLYDVGQIEVLRGPQGTLRGRASPSGSIIVTTRRPDLFKAGGNVVATGNSVGTINFNGGIGIPIIEGVAAIRIAGVYDTNEGDRVRPINRNAVDGRGPSNQTRSGRISARIEPTDFLSFDGSYQKLRRDGRNFDQYASLSEVSATAPVSPVFIAAKDRLSISTVPRVNRQEYDIYNGQAQLRLAGQRLVYVFQRADQQINAFTPLDQANVFPTRRIGQELQTNSRATSHEVRLQNDERLFEIFDYVVGGLDLKTNTPSSFLSPTPVRLPANLGGGLVTVAQTPIQRLGRSHEQSVFGNLTAHIGDRLELSGGARYISYSSRGSLIVNRTNNIPDPDINDDHVIYTASAKYSFSPDMMVYANTGSSYRPAINAVGNFSLRQSVLERSFLSLPPETSKSYEIGFKSSLFDRRVRLNVSAYHQDFKNYPYRTPGSLYFVNSAATPGPNGTTLITPTVSTFNFVGAVPVDVNGGEAEISFSANDNWDISFIGSYSLGKIKNGTIPCNDLNGDGQPDVVTTAPTLAQLQAAVGANNISACQVTQRSAFSSPFSMTLQSEYRVPVSDAVNSYVRGLFTYNGRSQGDPVNAFDQVGSFGLLNLYAGFRDVDGRWEVSAFGKNLFNTQKATARSLLTTTSFQTLNPVTRATTSGITTSPYNTVSMTPLREFGVTMRWNFGTR